MRLDDALEDGQAQPGAGVPGGAGGVGAEDVSCASELDKGSVFTVRLPR